MSEIVKHVHYILPVTTDFRETRPAVCWEHMYGWMEGYGVLFDPVVLTVLGNIIPEWRNGWAGAAGAGDFLITSCKQASALFGESYPRGIYIRPSSGVNIVERDRVSEKERIDTPIGTVIYPVGYNDPLRYDRYASGSADWTIGESPAIAEMGNGATAVAFEVFGVLSQLLNESPEKRLTDCADLLVAMLRVTKECQSDRAPAATDALAKLRLDFQAYGVSRLMLQWLLDKRGVPRVETAGADEQLLEALVAWQRGDADATRQRLKCAFEELARVRQLASRLRMWFIEIPHMGILLEDRGWFELEWPEYARQTLEQYGRWTESGYRLSIEGGASCWRNLSRRFPKAVAAIGQHWSEGRIELTNGTFSLPYPLISPLLLQYWQFASGHEVFREVFGRVPQTYQAQEHALTPQMPELLTHFGYRRAIHMAQNHGLAPAEDHEVIKWSSPAGHAVASLAARHASISRKGVNYYLDMPLVHADLGDRDEEITYVNFMDFGFIPFRTQMVRAHAYAPVFGEYTTPSARLGSLEPLASSSRKRTYFADDYAFAAATFYQDHTNANAFSQPERVFALAHRFRQAQLAAWLAGEENGSHSSLAAIMPEICLQEAHDVMLVQDQRQGEFYKFSGSTPPYTRERLSEAVATRASATSKALDQISGSIGGKKPTLLLNAAEVDLGFARVFRNERFAGRLLDIGGEAYAVGDFGAWSAAHPRTDELVTLGELPESWGKWRVRIDSATLHLQFGVRASRLAPVDSLLGGYHLDSAKAQAAGPLLVLELKWSVARLPSQSLLMRVILSRDWDVAEIALSYALGREFSASDRWSDYLAMDVSIGETLESVRRFNPNVCSETREEMVNSPYFLSGRGVGGGWIALLNEGSSIYRVDRASGGIRWYFHVSCERVLKRRMALAFGASEAFQLSRAWSQGLLPVDRTPVQQVHGWFAGGWEGLSAEGFTEDGRMLVSNLRATSLNRQVAAETPPLAICGIDRKSRISARADGFRELVLGPFELGFVTLGAKPDVTREPQQKPYSQRRQSRTYSATK